jgi:succinyl-diaminopimelate desuccinylase
MQDTMNPISLTQQLVRLDTVNPPGNENRCATFLAALLERGGFTTELHEFAPGRPNLVARIEGTADTLPLCFSGHLDTVPLGAAPWSTDPFDGVIEGDRIYGRGSTDMKGGLAAIVIAALRIAKISKGSANLLLVFTASEETGCEGSHHLLQSGTILDRAGAIVVGEPTSNYPFIGHKGAIFLEARTTGTAAHGSMPEKGVNAIYKAARAVTRLEHFDFDVSPHSIYGMPTLNVGTIQGGTNINSVPDRASIGIDVRTVPGQRNEHVYRQLEACLGDEMELVTITNAEGFSTDPEDKWIQHVYDVVEHSSGERPTACGATYFTDASSLIPALGNPPTIVLGPGEPEMAHKTDEFCYISKIEAAVELYYELGRTWCGL